jgi:hypothetical protein
VVCWGMNKSGQCNVPIGLENVQVVNCGDDHTVAITQDKKVICWAEINVASVMYPKDLRM